MPIQTLWLVGTYKSDLHNSNSVSFGRNACELFADIARSRRYHPSIRIRIRIRICIRTRIRIAFIMGIIISSREAGWPCLFLFMPDCPWECLYNFN